MSEYQELGLASALLDSLDSQALRCSELLKKNSHDGSEAASAILAEWSIPGTEDCLITRHYLEQLNEVEGTMIYTSVVDHELYYGEFNLYTEPQETTNDPN